MNFAQMLMQKVTPLGTNPEQKDVPPTVKLSRTESQKEAMKVAQIARHARAIRRYKAVMGDEWVKTPTIEKRLGYEAAFLSTAP